MKSRQYRPFLFVAALISDASATFLHFVCTWSEHMQVNKYKRYRISSRWSLSCLIYMFMYINVMQSHFTAPPWNMIEGMCDIVYYVYLSYYCDIKSQTLCLPERKRKQWQISDIKELAWQLSNITNKDDDENYTSVGVVSVTRPMRWER